MSPPLAVSPPPAARKPTSARRIAAAQGLRACLGQLMNEALEQGFRLSALHIRVAILELEDVLAQAGRLEQARDRAP